MDSTTETKQKKPSNGTTNTMWDYEAPQYCDFSDTQTFTGNSDDMDKFFLTDHESKENISNEEEDFGSSDSSLLFQTPMRDSTMSSSATKDDFYSPKVASNFKIPNQKTPSATSQDQSRGSIYGLRQTPLRNLYQNGNNPLQEKGQTPKAFGSRRKSRIGAKGGDDGEMKKKAVQWVDEVAEQFGELNVSGGKSEVAEVITITDDEEERKVVVQDQQVVDVKESDLLSEDEDDDGDHHEQTVCEANSTFEKLPSNESLLSEDGNAEPTVAPAVDFHPITDQELDSEKPSDEELLAQDVANSSRRSSYIVKSPSIRVVHFAEEAIAEEKPEQMVTPTMPAEASKKIKNRQQTPLIRESTSASSSAKPRVAFNQRFTKYLKRLSNKSISDEEGVAKLPEKLDKSKVKKRVTIAVPDKTSTTAKPAASATVTKGKIGRGTLSLKPRFSFARPSLKSTSFARPKSTGPSAQFTAASGAEKATKKSPYLGLAVLNNKFMSSVRHNSPFASWKPKATIPKAPKLLTEQRMGIRKYNTLPVLTNSEPVVPKAKLVTPKPVPRQNSGPVSTKHVTKAITPQFASDSRIKVWHMKHDEEAVDGAAAASAGPKFKARPVPNFKLLQAHEEKRKKEALEKCKRDMKNHKSEPFNFESRAHSQAAPRLV